jgi:hypothetical protein
LLVARQRSSEHTLDVNIPIIGNVEDDLPDRSACELELRFVQAADRVS